MYLRLSVTDQCDYRCRYCRPPGAPAPASDAPRLGTRSLLTLIRLLHDEVSLHKIRITGGEPLLRPDLPELVGEIRAMLPAAELALTTNAHRLAGKAAALRSAGLDRINVSLDSTDEAQFERVTGVNGLARVRQGLGAAREAGFAAPKLNTVLLRSVAGAELEQLLDFAAMQQAELRFIELMPFGLDAHYYRREYLSADAALAQLSQGARYRGEMPASGTAVRHRFTRSGRDVIVGFIRSVSHPFCDRCDRLRLDSRGRLRTCLRRRDRLDLPQLMKHSDQERTTLLRTAIASKPDAARRWPNHSMTAIGG